MRIWYQSMADISRYPTYGEALRARAGSLLRPDTTVEVFGVAPGTYGELPPTAVSIHPLAYHVLLDQVVGLAIRAEREGFDVMALGSFSEPHLRVIRSAVDIPVVSLAESTLLTGCQVARRVGIVTVTPHIRWMIEHLVDGHRLGDRVAGIRVLEPAFSEDDLARAQEDPTQLVEAFTTAARDVIENDFADVVIPAEGILSQMLADLGVRQLDGVSVMDCSAVTLTHAEMMGTLRRATGLGPGRRWEYLYPDAALRARLRDHAAEFPLSAASYA
ncbi:MAG TPA: aspartate/glutamate racemase family protein [Lapillicoccus sp.]|nr:aspartate/glutamate racemase family protein [Lapillicoccus sp.]